MCSHSGGESIPLHLPVDLTHSALRTSSPVHEAILAKHAPLIDILPRCLLLQSRSEPRGCIVQ